MVIYMNMENSMTEEMPPVPPAQENVAPEVDSPNIPAENVDKTVPSVELPIENLPVPVSESDPILGIKSDGVSFLEWALDNAVSFLELANLDGAKTAESLRGVSEDVIRGKVQMANSVLVLLANYGSHHDNAGLVSACELYAEKMKTIIKRLCL